VPEAAVDEHAMDTVNAVEPDNAHTAMADEVTATKTANGEPTTTEAMAADRMAGEAMAPTTVATTATAAATTGVGDLRQRDEHGDKHCEHQIEQLSHDTLLFGRFSPVAQDVPKSWRSCGRVGRIYRSKSIAAPTSIWFAARWCRRHSGARSRAHPRIGGSAAATA
jgi:hypothetical protein